MTQNNMEVVAWMFDGEFLHRNGKAVADLTFRGEQYGEYIANTLTSDQAEIEGERERTKSARLLLEHAENTISILEGKLTHQQDRAEAAEKERDALREALDSARNLQITDAELVRMNNSAVGADEVRISSRMLWLLVGLAMSTRSALRLLEPKNEQ